MTDRFETTRAYAATFARELLGSPRERQNWHCLTSDDDIPDGDYEALVDECGDVTDEMLAVYRDTFNGIAFPDDDA